jgi:hypothetical protein
MHVFREDDVPDCDATESVSLKQSSQGRQPFDGPPPFDHYHAMGHLFLAAAARVAIILVVRNRRQVPDCFSFTSVRRLR